MSIKRILLVLFGLTVLSYNSFNLLSEEISFRRIKDGKPTTFALLTQIRESTEDPGRREAIEIQIKMLSFPDKSPDKSTVNKLLQIYGLIPTSAYSEDEIRHAGIRDMLKIFIAPYSEEEFSRTGLAIAMEACYFLGHLLYKEFGEFEGKFGFIDGARLELWVEVKKTLNKVVSEEIPSNLIARKKAEDLLNFMSAIKKGDWRTTTLLINEFRKNSFITGELFLALDEILKRSGYGSVYEAPFGYWVSILENSPQWEKRAGVGYYLALKICTELGRPFVSRTQ